MITWTNTFYNSLPVGGTGGIMGSTLYHGALSAEFKFKFPIQSLMTANVKIFEDGVVTSSFGESQMLLRYQGGALFDILSIQTPIFVPGGRYQFYFTSYELPSNMTAADLPVPDEYPPGSTWYYNGKFYVKDGAAWVEIGGSVVSNVLTGITSTPTTFSIQQSASPDVALPTATLAESIYTSTPPVTSLSTTISELVLDQAFAPDVTVPFTDLATGVYNAAPAVTAITVDSTSLSLHQPSGVINTSMPNLATNIYTAVPPLISSSVDPDTNVLTTTMQPGTPIAVDLTPILDQFQGTLNVPADQPTLTAAMTFLNTKRLTGPVTISIANGTYTSATVIILNHPQGNLISIIGQSLAGTILDFTVTDGLGIGDGNFFGSISNLTIRTTTQRGGVPGSWNIRSLSGIYCVNCSNIASISNVTITGFYYAIRAAINSSVSLHGGVTLLNGGDANLFAFGSSAIEVYGTLTSSGASDTANTLGYGIVSENASFVRLLNGATLSGNAQAGAFVLSGSSAWLNNVVCSSSLYGIKVSTCSYVRANAAVATPGNLITIRGFDVNFVSFMQKTGGAGTQMAINSSYII